MKPVSLKKSGLVPPPPLKSALLTALSVPSEAKKGHTITTVPPTPSKTAPHASMAPKRPGMSRPPVVSASTATPTPKVAPLSSPKVEAPMVHLKPSLVTSAKKTPSSLSTAVSAKKQGVASGTSSNKRPLPPPPPTQVSAPAHGLMSLVEATALASPIGVPTPPKRSRVDIRVAPQEEKKPSLVKPSKKKPETGVAGTSHDPATPIVWSHLSLALANRMRLYESRAAPLFHYIISHAAFQSLVHRLVKVQGYTESYKGSVAIVVSPTVLGTPSRPGVAQSKWCGCVGLIEDVRVSVNTVGGRTGNTSHSRVALSMEELHLYEAADPEMKSKIDEKNKPYHLHMDRDSEWPFFISTDEKGTTSKTQKSSAPKGRRAQLASRPFPLVFRVLGVLHDAKSWTSLKEDASVIIQVYSDEVMLWTDYCTRASTLFNRKSIGASSVKLVASSPPSSATMSASSSSSSSPAPLMANGAPIPPAVTTPQVVPSSSFKARDTPSISKETIPHATTTLISALSTAASSSSVSSLSVVTGPTVSSAPASSVECIDSKLWKARWPLYPERKRMKVVEKNSTTTSTDTITGRVRKGLVRKQVQLMGGVKRIISHVVVLSSTTDPSPVTAVVEQKVDESDSDKNQTHYRLQHFMVPLATVYDCESVKETERKMSPLSTSMMTMEIRWIDTKSSMAVQQLADRVRAEFLRTMSTLSPTIVRMATLVHPVSEMSYKACMRERTRVYGHPPVEALLFHGLANEVAWESVLEGNLAAGFPRRDVCLNPTDCHKGEGTCGTTQAMIAHRWIPASSSSSPLYRMVVVRMDVTLSSTTIETYPLVVTNYSKPLKEITMDPSTHPTLYVDTRRCVLPQLVIEYTLPV